MTGWARRYWFTILVTAGLAVFIATSVDFGEFGRVFIQVSWPFVALAVLANFASIMLKVTSWKIIFDHTFRGIRGRWLDLTSALMIGFLVNAVVPARLGEIARALVISRRQDLKGEPVSRSTAFGTIVLERVFDGVAMGTIVVYGIVHMDLPGWAYKGAILLIALSFCFAAALVLLDINRKRLMEGSEAAAATSRAHHPLWRKATTRLYGVIARFSEGQRMLRSPRRVITVFCSTVASWTAQLMAIYFSLMAFHLGQVGVMGALLLLILINVAGALPATPANVGVFQLATVIPLSITYGIPQATALAFSVGLQVIEGSIGVGIGSAFLLREGLTLEQVRSDSRRQMKDFTGSG
jgi:phosphatidylinositol alpha-mannosyltransferase